LEEQKKSTFSDIKSTNKSGVVSSIHDAKGKGSSMYDTQTIDKIDRYGDRCPIGFKKLKSLGKGGIA
jgi:hypothetical protein